MANKKDTAQQNLASEQPLASKSEAQDMLVSQKASQNQTAASIATEEQLAFIKKHPFLSKILHPKIVKDVSDKNRDLLKSNLETRNETARRACASVLEALDAKCSAEVGKYGTAVDAEYNAFLNQLLVKRKIEASKALEKFVEQTEKDYKYAAEKISIPSVKERAIARAEKNTETFFQLQDEFDEKFLEKVRFRAAKAGRKLENL